VIHVSEPVLHGNERKYVLEALEGNRLSMGPFVERLEAAFAAYVGTRHAIAVSSGTAALHLALLALGVGPGDEVIVPALTFVATANAVRYCGAKPVIVDVDPETWCMDVSWMRRYCSQRTKAIVPVHLFGHPAAAAAWASLGYPIVEDAAEALGASLCGHRAGSLGKIGCFSLYGNKIVTCGEGGVVTTDDDDLAERLRLYRGQGQGERRYYHEVIGYNYRLTDLQAAVALAQLETIEWHLRQRERVAYLYHTELPLGVTVQLLTHGARPANWMVAVKLPGGSGPAPVTPTMVAERLAAKGIETRPMFTPLHLLPMYQDGVSRPVAEDICHRGLCLPTHAALSEGDVRTVCEALREAIA
jgi:perosamine synthetase